MRCYGESGVIGVVLEKWPITQIMAALIVQITELERMRKDTNMLNKAFRLFNRLLRIAFLMKSAN